MIPPRIELKNITIKFSDETILKDISLEINKGEKLVLVGPSGQGKSVLLKVMAGLIKPKEGHLFLDGEDFYKLNAARHQEWIIKMGMLFQKNALFDSLTCGENIAFPLREATRKTEEIIQSIVDQFLEVVGLSHAKYLFPDEISGGMQKRLGIARALALNPEIIFYDDPTAGLDPITSRRIIELIKTLQKENQGTMVAITNDMNRAYQLADRIAMVVDKKVIVTGTPEETKKSKDARVYQFINGLLKGPLTVIE